MPSKHLAGKPERSTVPRRANDDPIWQALRAEAEAAMAAEPALTGFIYATVASHGTLEEAICHRIAQRLGHADVDAGLIFQEFRDVLASQPKLGHAFRADLAAVLERDPACTRYLEPFLYFKGFHALVTYRFAHELWRQGRRDFALYLQSQSSRMFTVDIHPAARLGVGLMLDHATGVVIGETATVGDDCSAAARRHPRRQRQADGRPPSEDRIVRPHRRGRESARQHSRRQLLAHRRRQRRAAGCAATCHGRGHPRAHRWTGRYSRARPQLWIRRSFRVTSVTVRTITRCYKTQRSKR